MGDFDHFFDAKKKAAISRAETISKYAKSKCDATSKHGFQKSIS